MSKLSTTCLIFTSLFALAAADFPLAAWGYGKPKRVWYGDGHLYCGPTVPKNIEMAFNFTIMEPKDPNSDFWYIIPSPDDTQNLDDVFTIGDPLFLAISPNEATSPVFFTSGDTDDLTGQDIAYAWMHYQSLAIPIAQDSGRPIAGRTFLKEVEDTKGTYMVVWNENSTKEGGLIEVKLLTTMGDDEEEVKALRV